MENCPICDGNEFLTKYSLSDYRITSEPFELSSCANCSFIITENAPSPESIGRYYESEEYLEHSNKSEGLFSTVYHTIRDFVFGLKHRIVRTHSKGKTLLDIGAGSGHFIDYMQNQGYQVEGIELSEKAREYAKDNFNLDIRKADWLYNGSKAQKYSVITMWHVLEHLYDLNKVVNRLGDMVDSGGKLIIAVPNTDSIDARFYGKHWAAWDVPRHLWHFQPECFIKLMSKHGFQLVGLKMLPFDPFFNSLLSERYRHGDSIFNIFKATFIGLWSFLVGLFKIRKASSVVYILSKND